MIDSDVIQQAINQAVLDGIKKTVDGLKNDPQWNNQIELLIKQAVVQRTQDTLSNIDIAHMVHDRVDQNMKNIKDLLLTNFSSTGIDDRATTCQLTIMDDTTVVENQLTTNEMNVVGSLVTQNLVVKGAINTDNQSWQELASIISNNTFNKLNDEWRTSLVADVAEKIKNNGIEFDSITVNGDTLIDGNRLSSKITESNLQSVGNLKELKVQGHARFTNTLNVMNGRIGVNTEEPEMALSVWDEEVSIVAGKFKKDQAYIGTSRNSALAIGVNRQPSIEIDVDGETRIRKLRVAQWQVGHSTEVPGWSGTRGDIVFNANFGNDRVFAWLCLGGFKWQTLKSAE